MFNRKRLIVGLIMGALLGVFCIVGAQLRSGFERETLYLFAFWYNRLLIGFAIGIASSNPNLKITLLRGALIGLLVSFAFYSATGFDDVVGFIAGIVYGVIIEFVAYKVIK
jgi:uncharacterized membrane protein